MTEAVSLTAGAKNLVAENAANGTSFNLGWTSQSSTVVQSVDINTATGVITTTLNAATTSKVPGGGTITLTPNAPAGTALTSGTVPDTAIVWTCGGTVNVKYKPANCR